MIASRLTLRAFAEIVGIIVGAASIIYISRIVGPEFIGFSATTSAITLLLSRIADGGLTALASQRLARDDDRLESLLSLTLLPKFLLSLLLILLTLSSSFFLPVDEHLKYFLRISVFVILLESCTPAWIFVALGRINTASIIRITQSLLYAVAIILMIHKPDDWRYIPYLTVFNSAINFVLASFFLIKFKLYSFDGEVFRSDYRVRLKEFYVEGFNFLKADISVYLYTTSDRLILYYFTNSYTVGLYEAAYKIINPFYSINTVITPTMFRELAQSFKMNRVAPVMAKYLFSMSLLTIPLGFFLLFFASPVINLIYGSRFSGSAPSLMILGFVITFGFTSGIIVQPFAAWNMSKEYGSSIFWGNAVNILLNFTLIPFMGGVGAALATLAAKVIVTVVGYFYFRRATEYPIVKDFSYFFIAAVCSFVPLLLLKAVFTTPLMQSILYGSTYLGVICLMYKFYFSINLKSTNA